MSFGNIENLDVGISPCDADNSYCWKCPNCGYRLDDDVYLNIRFDFTCTKCNSSHLSDYQRGAWND